jgi:C_GCAxxG_C_C family probable redox protein
MNKKEKAIRNFKTMNCNQSVFTAYASDFGISEELSFSLGLAFGGGMGHLGKTCGTVTGAYIVIGLWCARKTADRKEQKQLAELKVKEFTQLFIERNGSIECKELLKYDLSIPDEAMEARNLDLFNIICSDLVGSSAEILEAILI